MSRDVQSEIKQVVESNAVVLFMKGNRDFPQCGFSARVVEILNSFEVPFGTVDVLSDPEVRQGIKVFSNWPTLPQLYVNAEFIGGCDIVTEMHLNGQLDSVLKAVEA